MSVNFDIHPNEIIAILEKLAKNINKDKHSLCLALDLINDNLHQWYNSITAAYAPLMAAFLQDGHLDPQTTSDFLKFKHSRDRSSAVKHSIEFLNNTESRFQNGELKCLENMTNEKKLLQLKLTMNKFFKEVFDNEITSLDILQDGVGNKENAEIIEHWIKNLDSLREEVREYISKIHMDLNCEKQIMDSLYRKLK
jgi:hypothetical protein